MEPKTKHKETVTMTVEIPKELRTKLDRLKGIYGCDTVGCAVSSIIDDVQLKDVFVMMANKESDDSGISQSDPINITGSLHSEEENNMIAFCVELKERLGYNDIDQISAMIDAEIIKVIDTTKPTRSPVGEIPDDIEEWKD